MEEIELIELKDTLTRVISQLGQMNTKFSEVKEVNPAVYFNEFYNSHPGIQALLAEAGRMYMQPIMVLKSIQGDKEIILTNMKYLNTLLIKLIKEPKEEKALKEDMEEEPSKEVIEEEKHDI